MDFKTTIQRNRQILVHCLHGDIIELFKHNEYITFLEYDRLMDITNRSDRNSQFIDIIQERINEKMHNKFIKMLETDYYWLAHRLMVTFPKDHLAKPPDQKIKSKEECVEDILSEGCVPSNLSHNLKVKRRVLLDKLRGEFQNLKPGGFILLHGMVGSGKSSLAADALSDYHIVFKVFDSRIFWLKSIDNVRDLQLKLYDQLNPVLRKWNAARDNVLLDDNSDLSQLIKSMMSECFNGVNNGLVVIDDINSDESGPCINFINELKCKTLIISENSGIIDRHLSNVKLVKVDEYFTLNESLSLLAKAIGIENVRDLPKEAKKLHEAVNGFPMSLKLIAVDLSLNSEDVKRNPGRWQNYISELQHKKNDGGNNKNNRRSSEHIKDPLDAAIKLSIDKLLPEFMDYYKHLAIFEKDVNLTPQVLIMLWDRTKVEVENIMNHFVFKSLAIRMWNAHLNCYVYGIHNLLLENLKNRFENEVKELHKILIDNYSKKCNNQFWLLDNDNYIFLYLGYHLVNAEYFDMFRIFLDLDFIGAKIRAAGLRDTIRDLVKYKNYIVTQDSDEKLYDDILSFIKNVGHTIQYTKDIDIIQLALQQQQDTPIYQAALNLGSKRPSESVFVKFLGTSVNYPNSFGLRGDEVIACFTDTENDVFIGTRSGEIKCRYGRNNSIKRILRGHKSQVKHFETSFGQRLYLLSVAAAAGSNRNSGQNCVDEIRVWSVVDLNQSVNGSNIYHGSSDGDRSPSPGLRQDSYCGMWPGAGNNIEECMMCFQGHKDVIYCAKFSPKDGLIVSCSKDKEIYIWSYRSNYKLSVQCGSVPLCCTFSFDGSLVLVGQENRDIVFLDSGINQLTYRTENSIIALYPISGIGDSYPGNSGCHDFVVLMDQLVGVIRYVTDTDTGKKFVTVLRSWVWESNLNEKKDYKCKSCINMDKDFSFIAITTTCHSISVYNLEDGEKLKKYETNGEIVALDTIKDSDGTPLLMAACKDKSVCIWKVIFTAMKPNFSCLPLWKNSEPIIVVPGDQNCHVMSGRRTICTLAMSCSTEVAVTSHLLNDSHVVVGTNLGKVWLYIIQPGISLVSNGKLKITFDPEDGTSSKRMKRSSVSGSEVVFVRVYRFDGKLLIIAIDNNNVLKVNYGGEVYTYNANAKIVGCYFIPKSKKIITIDRNSCIKLWSVDLNLENEDNFNNSSVTVRICDVCTDPDGSPLIAIIPDEKLIFLTNLSDIFDGANFPKLVSVQTASKPTCCNFSPDGKQLAVGFNDGILKIFNTEDITGNSVVKSLGTCPIKAVCLENNLVFGALGSNRVYLGDSNVFGKTQLTAEQIYKDPDSNRFVTLDNEGTVHVITFWPLAKFKLDLMSVKPEFEPNLSIN